LSDFARILRGFEAILRVIVRASSIEHIRSIVIQHATRDAVD